jgi:homoserine dehydrogenase
LASLAAGRQIPPKQIQTIGIRGVKPEYLSEAGEKGYAVKLLGRAQIPESGPPLVFVEPHLVAAGHPFHNVNDEFNCVLITGDVVGDVIFCGKGAGRRPTASAIVSDIVACMRSNDPLGGLAWHEIPVRVAAPADPESGPCFRFADGAYMRLMR